MELNNVDLNEIIVCKTIVKEGVKKFYINNVFTPINNIEFIEDNDNPFLDISPLGIKIYLQDITNSITEGGLDVISGRRHKKYTLTVQKDTKITNYKFVLMSDGNLEVPGGLL